VGRTTDRGFTEHEHLDEMGVVHMNGRIYDPLVGRFMSADPFIQAPSMLQSYNRYAYVMNNPLNLTDPSGYSWWTRIRGTVVRAIAAVADAYGCSGYCSAAVGAYQGAKNGGGLGGAVVGGLRGYYGYQYGGDYGVTGYAVSAVGGCASAAVNGGNCGRGAAGGVVDHFGSQYGIGGTTAAGCVSSRISGGSCGQGARDAATSYAVTYVVKSGIKAGVEIYQEAERYDAEQRRGVLIACGPCVVAIPPVVSFGVLLLRSTFGFFGGIAVIDTAKHVNALSVNGADDAKEAATPNASPEIKPDELSGKTKPELEQLARDKGLVQDPKNPGKWRDPETGKERLLIHPGHIDPQTGLPYNNPNAAAPHTHGFDSRGKKIGNPSNGNDPHFPIKP
jgi:RHS repeat-associated protein